MKKKILNKDNGACASTTVFIRTCRERGTPFLGFGQRNHLKRVTYVRGVFGSTVRKNINVLCLKLELISTTYFYCQGAPRASWTIFQKRQTLTCQEIGSRLNGG